MKHAISTKWLAKPNRGHSCWSTCDYLIHRRLRESFTLPLTTMYNLGNREGKTNSVGIFNQTLWFVLSNMYWFKVDIEVIYNLFHLNIDMHHWRGAVWKLSHPTCSLRRIICIIIVITKPHFVILHFMNSKWRNVGVSQPFKSVWGSKSSQRCLIICKLM